MVKTTSRNAIQEKAASSPQNFWQTVNSLLGKRISSEITLNINGELESESNKLAAEFSKFFKNEVDDFANLKDAPIREMGLQPQHGPVSFSLGLLDKVLKNITPQRNVMALTTFPFCLQETLLSSIQTSRFKFSTMLQNLAYPTPGIRQGLYLCIKKDQKMTSTT
jgi:hypothetical protein